MKSGDQSFRRYINETTGYDFEVDNVVEKRLNSVLREGRIRDEDECHKMLDVRRELEPNYTYSNEKLVELNRILEEFVLSSSEEDNQDLCKEISVSYSPSGLCKLTVIENRSDERDPYTQVLLDFGNEGGSGVYAVDGIDLDIRAYWWSSNRIVIETQKPYVSSQKWHQIQYYSNIIEVA